MLHDIKKRESGFTIIEVLIVLAIAGLILLVVFLAVPALQRNSRNTQRKSDASHLAGLITEWESNNGGTAPTGFSSSGTPAAGKIDLSTEKFAFITAPTAITAYASQTAPTNDTPLVLSGATCNGNAVAAATSSRAVVVWFYIEGSTGSGCVSAS